MDRLFFALGLPTEVAILNAGAPQNKDQMAEMRRSKELCFGSFAWMSES